MLKRFLQWIVVVFMFGFYALRESGAFDWLRHKGARP
jgi:hypothetical protein